MLLDRSTAECFWESILPCFMELSRTCSNRTATTHSSKVVIWQRKSVFMCWHEITFNEALGAVLHCRDSTGSCKLRQINSRKPKVIWFLMCIGTVLEKRHAHTSLENAAKTNAQVTSTTSWTYQVGLSGMIYEHGVAVRAFGLVQHVCAWSVLFSN